MSHTPYGYRIKNGKAIIDVKAAVKLEELYRAYLSGLSLKNTTEKAGIDCCHATVSRMLTNRRYTDDEFYPQIIDKEIFEKVQEENKDGHNPLGEFAHRRCDNR